MIRLNGAIMRQKLDKVIKESVEKAGEKERQKRTGVRLSVRFS